MLRSHLAITSALAGGLLCAIAGTASAQQPAPSAAAPAASTYAPAAQIQLVKDPRALASLKAMSDRLASTKSFTVRAENTVPMLGPNLQWISL